MTNSKSLKSVKPGAAGEGLSPPAEACRESEFCAVLDGVDIALLVFTADGNLCHANASARRLLDLDGKGITRDVLSRLSWCAVGSGDAPASDTEFPWSTAALAGNADTEKVMCLNKPDGSERTLLVRARTYGMPGNEEAKLAVYLRDITEQTRLEESHRMNSQLLEASQAIAKVGGWELDLETNDLFWTAETYRIHETTPEEFSPSLDSGLDVYLPESRRILSAALDEAINKGAGFDLELEIRTLKEHVLHVRATCKVTCVNGKPSKLTGTFQDITAAKRAEIALREAGQFAQDTLDSLDASICVLDESGTIVAVNQMWLNLSGDTTRTAVETGLNYLEVCDAVEGDDAAIARSVAAGIRSVIQGEKELFYTEYPCHLPERQQWNAMRVRRFQPGGKPRVVVAHADITERWEAQSKLRESQEQLQELAKRLQAAKEEESRRIAGVVHDELGQQLTGLKMDLRAIEKLLERADPDATRKALRRTGEATKLIDQTAHTVQMIASALRPAILDQLGLWSALREEARVFGKRTQLKVQLQMPEDEPPLSPEQGTACYRIVQEALTNVARHAQASRVDLIMTVHGSRLIMRIEDDGRGIDLQLLGHHQSIGLLGMRERVRQMDGELVFMRRSEGGTVVRAEFDLIPPVKPEEYG